MYNIFIYDMNILWTVLLFAPICCGFRLPPSRSNPLIVRANLFERDLFVNSLEYIVSREALLSSLKTQASLELIDANPLLKHVDYAIKFYPNDWFSFITVLTLLYITNMQAKTDKLEDIPQFKKKRQKFEKCFIIFAVIFMKNVENAI